VRKIGHAFHPPQACLGRGTTRRVVEGYSFPIAAEEYPSTMLRMVPLPGLAGEDILEPDMPHDVIEFRKSGERS
jgi:hypothetical protein